MWLRTHPKPQMPTFHAVLLDHPISKLYKNNGATPIYSYTGGPLIGYGQGSCVGGSTFINAGYFSSTPAWVFDQWKKDNKVNSKLLSIIEKKFPPENLGFLDWKNLRARVTTDYLA